MMRLWIDDIRPMPDDFDVWAKTAGMAVVYLAMGGITHVSFDHDLGDEFDTGYSVAKYIEQGAFEGVIGEMTWDVHSANPVGAENIRKAMTNADKFWFDA